MDCASSRFQVTSARYSTRLMFVRLYCSTYSRLGAVVSREVCRYIGAGGFLVAPTHGRLFVWDLETLQAAQLPLALQFSPGTTLCVAGTDLFLVGGTQQREVWKVNLSTGHAESGSLREPRGWTAVAAHAQALWVFGGACFKVKRSAEVYDISTKHSSPLPEMPTPKSQFTAILLGEEIYLPHVDRLLKPLEAFHTVTHRYRRLALRLSDPGSGLLCACAGDSLWLFTSSHKVCRWQVDSAQEEVQYVGAHAFEAELLWTTTPTCHFRCLYFPRIDGGFQKFDLNSVPTPQQKR